MKNQELELLTQVHEAFRRSDGSGFAAHYREDAAMVLSNGMVLRGRGALASAASESGASVKEWSLSETFGSSVEGGRFVAGKSHTRLQTPDGPLDLRGARLIFWDRTSGDPKIAADISIPGSRAAIPKSISARYEALSRAWNQHDVESTLDAFAPEITYVTSDGRVRSGESVRDMLDFAFAADLQGMQVEPGSAWLAADDTVYVASRYRFSVQTEGERIPLAGCQLDVWKRAGSEWNIAVRVAQPEGSEACVGMPERRVSAGGLEFRWRIVGDRLVGEMSAPTEGWVTVGFNDRSRLDGARLVMGRFRDNRAQVEEHIAAPPNHRRNPASGVRALDGKQQDGRTLIEFELPLSGSAGAPDLRPGFSHHLILAFSERDDFDHHSIFRTGIDTEL